MTVVARIERRFLAEAPPERIATCRILVGAFGFAYVGMRAPELLTAEHAEGTFAPVGLLHLLPSAPPSATATVLVVVTMLLAMPFALGWRFRALGPAFVVALFAVLSYRSSWGMIFHSENLLLLHALVLAVAPSADVWSLDARRGAPPPRRHGHGWPLRVIAAVTVCAYLLAGIAKLRLNGWDWVTGEYLRHHVAYDALRKVQLGAMASPIGTAMVAHGWMFPPFAAFAVAVELGAPLGLVGRWPGRIWAVGIWLFHWGVLAVMGIPFHYALSGFAFVAFFDVERWARGLERWVRRRARAREPA